MVGTKTPEKLLANNQMLLSYSSEHKCWVGPFLMAGVMATCVRRSTAINNYTLSRSSDTDNEKRELKYYEAAVYPNFFAGVVSLIGYMVLGSCLAVCCKSVLHSNT
jgi:hypothetical protein